MEAAGIARTVGVYVAAVDAAGSPLAMYRSDDDFPAASVIKVPVMLALYARWADGSLRRTSSQEDLLRRMIEQSDNNASNALMDQVGIAQVNRVITTLLQRRQVTTVLSRRFQSVASGRPKNRACPQEMAALLACLSERERQKDPAAVEMLELMRHTAPHFRQRIPAGVPLAYRSRVANKTGTLERVVNDVALVETPGGRRYALCILMEGVSARETAVRFCRDISQRCWRTFVSMDQRMTARASRSPS